ncbi:hypothetical protein [Eggerthella guodeyinii]|uniref:Uncharacterized protein n=1 Tax=Eggerthella guodeyinii TaxID=2690837 RepID=A0A6N7RLE6_9ACTN|nr:hypothetical protein [Eggerthella guodeyinii]MRX81767.1 hypothetical protein [Eggerthella guodeyinii]
MTESTRLPHRSFEDERGASIVIALVFFLICGIIGSVVVTAASVQAKAAQTHIDLQQDEYTMQSAAELVAQQLGGKVGVEEEVDGVTQEVVKNAVTIAVSYRGEDPVADVSQVYSQLGKSFWSKDRAETALTQTVYIIGRTSERRIIIDPSTDNQLDRPVFAMITIDSDLNMTVELSLDNTLSPDSRYNMTVSIQCTPSYDIDGKLTAFSYGDNTVIEKSS